MSAHPTLKQKVAQEEAEINNGLFEYFSNDRANELLGLWKKYATLDEFQSFWDFAKKNMKAEEIDQCKDWIESHNDKIQRLIMQGIDEIKDEMHGHAPRNFFFFFFT